MCSSWVWGVIIQIIHSCCRLTEELCLIIIRANTKRKHKKIHIYTRHVKEESWNLINKSEPPPGVLLSYRLPFILAWSNPSISSHMGCSSVHCLWEEEQGGRMFYKYSGFLHAGLDWGGWASHAGTSQPGGWGVALEWREGEWRHEALPLILEPVLALVRLQNQPSGRLYQFHKWM